MLTGWALPLLAVALLVACDRAKPGAAATQIAAKVNKEEISVHQVNYALQRQPGLSSGQLDEASRRALEALVDQELTLQAATEERLDRDPAVMQAIEAARRELLARAYTERLVSAVQPPSATEVRQYYDSKPALFSKRRLYTLVDTAIAATPAQQKSIQAQLPGTRNAADVAAVLRQTGVRFGAKQSTVGADALPMHAVDAMAALREGQSLLVSGPRDAHVLTVVAVRLATLTPDQASPSIEAYLTAERGRQLVQQQIKVLRSAAHIEYRGRFAASAPSTEATASATPAPAAEAASGLSSVSLRQALASFK